MKALLLKLTILAAFFAAATPAHSQTFNREMLEEAIQEMGTTWRFIEQNSDGQNIRFVGMRARDYLEENGYYSTALLVNSFSTVGQIFEGNGLRLSNGVYLEGDVNDSGVVYMRLVVHF